MEQKKSNFKEIKSGKKNHYKYHLFSANFETYNFESLLKETESTQNKGFLWNYPKNIKVEIGDIVYIYYFNLPDRINRILLKCKVIDAFKKGENEECFYYDTEYYNTEEKINLLDESQNSKKPAMLLSFETALCVEKGKEKFSEKNLRENYGINNFQGKQYIKEDLLQEKIENGKQEYYQKKLIHDLEKETKNKTIKLEDLIKSMNKISQCALQRSPKFKHENHTTFVKENGLNYYEQHHLIQQFNGRKNKELKNIIDNDINLINLCPNCHRRIHNGKKEDRENMVIELYNQINQGSNDFDNLLLQIPEIKEGKKTAKNWLLEQYKLENQDKDI